MCRYKGQHVVWVDEGAVIGLAQSYLQKNYRDSYAKPHCLHWVPPTDAREREQEQGEVGAGVDGDSAAGGAGAGDLARDGAGGKSPAATSNGSSQKRKERSHRERSPR